MGGPIEKAPERSGLVRRRVVDLARQPVAGRELEVAREDLRTRIDEQARGGVALAPAAPLVVAGDDFVLQDRGDGVNPPATLTQVDLPAIVVPSAASHPKALVYVETWFGAGHLSVVSQAARALGEHGVAVTVATSATDMAKGFDFGKDTQRLDLLRWGIYGEGPDASLKVGNVEFPAVGRPQAQAALAELADGRMLDGSQPWHFALTQAFLERQRALAQAAHDAQAIVTEFWPLGGRALVNADLEPFISAQKQRPRPPQIFSIERDIVFPGPDADRRVARVSRYVDQMFVRGHPSFAAIEERFPQASDITKPIEHVGFFATPMPPRHEMPQASRPVLVTAGGGVTPQDVNFYVAAINAAPKTTLKDNPWRIMVPIGTAPATVERLQGLAQQSPVRMTVEPNLSSHDFREVLADAALAVTQAGYNAALDVATGGIPAVFVPDVPSTGAARSEQAIRAQMVAARTGAQVLYVDQAQDVSTVAGAIDKARAAGAKPLPLPIDGAQRFARSVSDRIDSRARDAKTSGEARDPQAR